MRKEVKTKMENFDAWIQEIKNEMESTMDGMILVPNVARIAVVQDAIKTILDSVRKENPDIAYEIQKDPLIGSSIVLIITAPEVTISKMNSLYGGLVEVDTLDIEWLTTEQIRVSFGFNFCYMPVGKIKT